MWKYGILLSQLLTVLGFSIPHFKKKKGSLMTFLINVINMEYYQTNCQSFYRFFHTTF